jgi:putative membrane protein
MKKLILSGKIWLLLVAALSLVTACKDDDDDDANEQPLTIQSFVQQAAASDTFEIASGSMAEQKGVLPDVKAFGTMIVTDHTMSSMELKALAAQKGVTVPRTIPADKLARLTLLSSLSGAPFDKAFSSQQVDAHQEAISLYEQADRDLAQDAQVQAFVDKTLPVLRTHLTHAQAIRDQTK